MFRPFAICSNRKELKHYRVILTLPCSRGIDIEVSYSLNTDFFTGIKSSRGRIRKMRSNNGSNFVGAMKELQKSIQNVNHNRTNKYLQMHGADWII